MEFIDIPTEQTTAVTDAILTILAVSLAAGLLRMRSQYRWKTAIWVWVMGLLALAGILGTIAHGFKMSKELQDLVWHPLNLSLGLLVALFIVGVVYDLRGEKISRRILPMMIIIGAGFFAITLIWPDSFLVFIIYEAVAMFFALGGYIWLALQGRLPGTWTMVIAIFATIIAAVAQAISTIGFTLYWTFDHNGVYHLIQMVGILLLFFGLRKTLLSQVPLKS